MSLPLPSTPDAIIWNKLRFHPASSSELLELISNANVFTDRERPVEKAIGRLIKVNGYAITEKKKAGEIIYTMK